MCKIFLNVLSEIFQSKRTFSQFLSNFLFKKKLTFKYGNRRVIGAGVDILICFSARFSIVEELDL